MADRWYVAQLKPNGFGTAQANLMRQGFESFCPMRLTRVRHARQMRDVLRPVFQGYLFVKFGADQGDWRAINSTLGIARLISFEPGQPAPVPEDLMAGLKARCDAHGLLQPMDDLKLGEHVRLTAGAFAGFVGEIDTLLSKDTVRLLFEMMGQKTHIDVPTQTLERLN